MFSFLVGSFLLYSCKKAATEIAEETSEVIGKKGIRKLSVEVEEQAVKDITEETGEISIKSVSKLIPNRPYSRIAIDKEFKIIKAKMHSEALQRGAKKMLNMLYLKMLILEKYLSVVVNMNLTIFVHLKKYSISIKQF